MRTIYLRFADREEALAQLAAVLGYGPESDPETGAHRWPAMGRHEGIRYDLDFLADKGVATGGGKDHVNLLWWGDDTSAPDFGNCEVIPATPSCGFAP